MSIGSDPNNSSRGSSSGGYRGDCSSDFSNSNDGESHYSDSPSRQQQQQQQQPHNRSVVPNNIRNPGNGDNGGDPRSGSGNGSSSISLSSNSERLIMQEIHNSITSGGGTSNNAFRHQLQSGISSYSCNTYDAVERYHTNLYRSYEGMFEMCRTYYINNFNYNHNGNHSNQTNHKMKQVRMDDRPRTITFQSLGPAPKSNNDIQEMRKIENDRRDGTNNNNNNRNTKPFSFAKSSSSSSAEGGRDSGEGNNSSGYTTQPTTTTTNSNSTSVNNSTANSTKNSNDESTSESNHGILTGIKSETAASVKAEGVDQQSSSSNHVNHYSSPAISASSSEVSSTAAEVVETLILSKTLKRRLQSAQQPPDLAHNHDKKPRLLPYNSADDSTLTASSGDKKQKHRQSYNNKQAAAEREVMAQVYEQLSHPDDLLVPGQPVQIENMLALTNSVRLIVQSSYPFIIVHCNAAYTRMSGIDSIYAIGKPLSQIMAMDRGSSGASSSSCSSQPRPQQQDVVKSTLTAFHQLVTDGDLSQKYPVNLLAIFRPPPSLRRGQQSTSDSGSGEARNSSDNQKGGGAASKNASNTTTNDNSDSSPCPVRLQCTLSVYPVVRNIAQGDASVYNDSNEEYEINSNGPSERILRKPSSPSSVSSDVAVKDAPIMKQQLHLNQEQPQSLQLLTYYCLQFETLDDQNESMLQSFHPSQAINSEDIPHDAQVNEQVEDVVEVRNRMVPEIRNPEIENDEVSNSNAPTITIG